MLSHDQNGLPVFAWDETNNAYKMARRCFIASDSDGTLMFVHEFRMSGNWRLILQVGGIVTIVGAIGAASLVRTIYYYMLGISDQAPIMGMSMLAAAVVATIATALLTYRWITGVDVQTKAAPWSALEAFAVTDDQTFLGQPKTRQVNTGGPVKPVDPTPVIFADFGDTAGPIVVSNCNFAQKALMVKRETLASEFIDRRREHLERLAREGREMENAKIGERRKVV